MVLEDDLCPCDPDNGDVICLVPRGVGSHCHGRNPAGTPILAVDDPTQHTRKCV